MRDISVTKRALDGTTTFSIANAHIISGADILVEKVSKAVYNKNRSTNYFTFLGLDLDSMNSSGMDSASLGALQLSITSSLKNIQQAIIQSTPVYAPMGEQLDSLILENIYYDTSTNDNYMVIRIYPKAGSVQIMTYPIDSGE
jgi:hypothetical protein